MSPLLPKTISLRRPPVVFTAMHRRLAANLRRTPDELAELQRRALRSRLLDAFRHVPAYREHGKDKALRKLLDRDPHAALRELPTTSRADLAANHAAYRHRFSPAATLVKRCTAGSSGEPLTVERDARTVLLEGAYVLRQWLAFGCERGDVVLRIRRDGPPPGSSKLVEWDVLTAEYRTAASRLDDDTVTRLLSELESLNVKVLRGYPSSVVEFTRRALALGREKSLRAAPVVALQVSSETLDPSVRRLLQESWQRPVMNHYGLAERALLIQSCPIERLHLQSDYAVGEVLDGQWHGTRLFGRGTVLLRYATGDHAGDVPHLDRCECGSPFAVVGPIDGRRNDVVVTPDGRRIGHLRNATKIVGVVQIQLQQEEANRIVARILLRPEADINAVTDELRARIRTYLASPEMDVDVRTGEPFVRHASGKVRPVIGLEG